MKAWLYSLRTLYARIDLGCTHMQYLIADKAQGSFHRMVKLRYCLYHKLDTVEATACAGHGAGALQGSRGGPGGDSADAGAELRGQRHPHAHQASRQACRPGQCDLWHRRQHRHVLL